VISLLNWIVQALGAFYAFAGIVVLRQMALDRLMDQALAALGEPVCAAERTRSRLLIVGGCFTLASGLALVTLSRWSVAIFAAAVLVHGGYLALAARAVPPQDEGERKGRRATVNAFIVYVAAFAFVIYAGWRGAMRPWPFLGAGFAAALAELGVIVAVTLAVAWYFQHKSNLTGESVFSRRSDTDPGAPRQEDEHEWRDEPASPRPHHLRLAPEYHCWPTWDEENGNLVDPADLGLSQALVDRINAWDARFQETYRDDDPYGSRFSDVAQERQWVRDGNAIAADLAREWPGPLTVRISSLEAMLRNAGHDLAPGEPIPETRADEIGSNSGVAEIEEIITRLDQLARDKNALPDWDGDAQDDVARAQALFARILASVPIRYINDVRRGLESPEAQTRTWIALALEWRDGRHDGETR